MKKPIISKILSLKDLGVFRNYMRPDALRLHRYNLIYGFNGSGKTTLSRVFACLQTGALHESLPKGGTFDIELSDGTVIKSTGDLGKLKSRVLVFNIDFVEENFKWKDGTANPVFHLGREQVELAKTLDRIADEKSAKYAMYKAAQTDHGNKQQALSMHKRAAARLIAEQLGLGRKYDATNLTNDYSSYTYDEAHRLSEEESQQLRNVLAREAPLPKLELLSAPTINVSAFVSQVQMILDTTLGDITVQDLRGHDSMLNWIRDGVTYHEAHDLSSCLLCAQDLTRERLKILHDTIDGKYDEFTRSIVEAKTKAETLLDSCAAIATAIPSINDISQPLRR